MDTILLLSGVHLFLILDINPVPTSGILWNFTFKLVVNVILVAIISGIIIDTFGEKRTKAEGIQDDTMSKCFICNIPNEEFERAGVPHTYHIEHEHNYSHYLWYMMKLQRKQPNKLSVTEKYFLENMSKNQIQHMPILKVKKS